MSRKLRLVLAVAVAGVVPRVPTSGADADQSVPCRFTAQFDMTPGLSLTPSSGAFTSGGETGAITCSGSVNGQAVTGSGTFGADGNYGTADEDSCVSGGEGSAVQRFMVPTAGGPAAVRNVITFTYQPTPGPGGSLALASGRFEGERFSGTFDVTLLEGDCVTSPVTRVQLDGRGMLRS